MYFFYYYKMLGTVITFGKKALTIATDDGNQYYAPADELAPCVIHKLQWPVKPFAVLFDVDKTRVSGVTLAGPRYYAMSVKSNE